MTIEEIRNSPNWYLIRRSEEEQYNSDPDKFRREVGLFKILGGIKGSTKKVALIRNGEKVLVTEESFNKNYTVVGYYD